MRKETDYFITTIRSILEGEPWYGQPVMKILQNLDPKNVYKKPNDDSHSLIELLYHMITWAEFALKRLEKDEEKDMASFEKLDWREINPSDHTWEKGMAQFKVTHDLIIEFLGTKDDEFLSEKVDYRDYNFRFLLHGIIQHDIYHIGQIVYLNKLVAV
ncbi:MAG: DinB family protein [Bacteroidetes bacterium]|nr:MAG: DinB family protein [Bacteroidota bacterium]